MAATTSEAPARGLKRAASSSPSPPSQLPPPLRNNGAHALPPRPPAAAAASSPPPPPPPLLPNDPSPSTWHLPLSPRTTPHWSTTRPRALFQQPEQLTTFSYDGSRQLHHDDRSLMHYHIPPPGADLDRGWKEGDYVSKDDSRNEHLDSLLYALMRLAERDEAADRTRRRADVVTWRGMATRLCTALYEQQQQQGWEMNAMLVQGTLYVEEHLSPAMLRDKVQRRPPHPPPPNQPPPPQASSSSSRDSNLARLTYHGSTFEAWSTHSPRSDGRPFDYQHDDPWSGPVNTNTQWCSIVKTRLGSSRLILGGEVDCVDDDGRKVELKTSMVIRGARDEQRFEEKMLRFYMQSFLLGVGRVVVGFRDARSGKLQATHDFATLDMPKLVRGKPHAWDPQAGLNLAEAVLAFVRKTIEEDEGMDEEKRRRDEAQGEQRGQEDGEGEEKPGAVAASPAPAVYRIAFAPSKDEIIVRRLGEQEVDEEVVGHRVDEEDGSDIERVGFLPASFYRFAMTREKLQG